jgi:Arylsulfotransferase (ASST)
MNKISIVLTLILILSFQLMAQILPRENSSLNYRLIGFSFPDYQNATNYKIEIATGNYNNEDSFKKNISRSFNYKTNRVIIEVPSFGKEYTWRVASTIGHSESVYSTLHHFRVGYTQEIDTSVYRFRIVQEAKAYKDAYVFLDANKCLYDMNGKPVWYLPKPELKNVNVRDLKITPQGTITYVIDEAGIFEVNYKGDIIWQGPNNGLVSGDSLEHYHHEFTRLHNGHYMALAQNFVYWKTPTPTDTNLTFLPKNKVKPEDINTTYMPAPMGTLIEYDKNGKIIWSWKSSNHFNGSNIFYRRTNGTGAVMHAHENSFFFDERSNSIYISCRNINSIIKIKYPEGNVLNIYDGGTNNSIDPDPTRLFSFQHSCKISQRGHLYFFNNNSYNPGANPSVIKFQEPISEKGTAKKIWEYIRPVDTVLSKIYPSGGNVVELEDESIFVSMPFLNDNVFIVNPDKEILWNAILEQWNAFEKKWEGVNLYRASIIPGREELEQLIWNEEVKIKRK